MRVHGVHHAHDVAAHLGGYFLELLVGFLGLFNSFGGGGIGHKVQVKLGSVGKGSERGHAPTGVFWVRPIANGYDRPDRKNKFVVRADGDVGQTGRLTAELRNGRHQTDIPAPELRDSPRCREMVVAELRNALHRADMPPPELRNGLRRAEIPGPDLRNGLHRPEMPVPDFRSA
jgi:hypothetical protein